MICIADGAVGGLRMRSSRFNQGFQVMRRSNGAMGNSDADRSEERQEKIDKNKEICFAEYEIRVWMVDVSGGSFIFSHGEIFKPVNKVKCDNLDPNMSEWWRGTPRENDEEGKKYDSDLPGGWLIIYQEQKMSKIRLHPTKHESPVERERSSTDISGRRRGVKSSFFLLITSTSTSNKQFKEGRLIRG